MSRAVEHLHPSFQPIVVEVLRRAPAAGLFPFMTEGRRSPEYQACLYAQGRFVPGTSHDVEGMKVHVSLSPQQTSVIVRCGNAANIVPLKKWRKIITQVGPYGSWHTLGLATDWSFRSNAAARDDLVAQIEEAAGIARAGGDIKMAALRFGLGAQKYKAFCDIWNAVCPDVIWGNDWDDDGIFNGPDPDNEWSDLPHFEWHPGMRSIRALTPDQRTRILGGSLPSMPKRCTVCGAFVLIAIDDVCRDCHDKIAGVSR